MRAQGPEGQRRSKARKEARPQRRANNTFVRVGLGLILSLLSLFFFGRLPWAAAGRWIAGLADSALQTIVVVAGAVMVTVTVAVTCYAIYSRKTETEERRERLRIESQERREALRIKLLERLDERDREDLVRVLTILGADRAQWSDERLIQALRVLMQRRQVLAKLEMDPHELIYSTDGQSYFPTQPLLELVDTVRQLRDQPEEPPEDNSAARG